MQLELGDGEQVLRRVRQQAEAVDHLHLQVAQFVGVRALLMRLYSVRRACTSGR
jgi:hypothetical protein